MRASFLIFLPLLGFSTSAFAKEPAFSFGGKTYDWDDLRNDDPAAFFEVEEKKYDTIEQVAHQRYLEMHWQREAKKAGKSVEAFKKEYMESRTKVGKAEIKELAERYKDNPNLKRMSAEERDKQIERYLADRKQMEVSGQIINDAMKKGDLKILYTRPKEPQFKIEVAAEDHIRFGSNPDDIKPVGCSDDCPVTVVEYSEFQCPFCAKVLPDTKRLLDDYKGKVRWVVRDFTLDGHQRARPAAIAAHCAGNQKKFWHMYNNLFDNQRALSDADFEKYAGQIKGLDVAKWKKCVKDDVESITKKIEANMQSGLKVGVNGTPAFFINGRRLSGAVPYDQFKRIFDEELQNSKKKKG